MNIKDLFSVVGSIRPGIGDRVRHKETRLVGTVIGKAKTRTRGVRGFDINMLTVNYDDGSVGTMIAENEFIKLDKRTPKQVLPVARMTKPPVVAGPIKAPELKGKRYSSAFGAEIEKDENGKPQ